MITQEILDQLLLDMESDLIERTISIRENKLGPAVCALSNDFPNHKKPGYILLGVKDDGKLAGMKWSDEELQAIGNVKTNGNVLPQPSMVVSQIFKYQDGEVVVIQVTPSPYPPVRYDGRCWIRIGPRMDKATVEEEKNLIERRASYAKTYDLVPALGASIEDLAIEYFKSSYLPAAIDKDTLRENGRSIEQQLASLRFFEIKELCPTNAGILLFGLNPEFYIPGAYIQYVRFKGEEMNSDVEFEKKFSGALITELNSIDDFIKNNIIKERPVKTDSFQEETVRNYPYWALRELLMNAIMHRNYESNSPIYIYEFSDRIEILNPGGLYGDVNAQNFPNTSDYRNVVVAEAMKTLGYVNRFNYGVKRATNELINNGNGNPDFDLTLGTKFKVSIQINTKW
ncbi:MAG TPA: ATP-binding protein [Saprospiraceae bacterium]|nr:putative DNA binding domain-containing protein [Saprospiraceae bacterium]MBK6667147.1 putative DNA binding domain-containing protein [Saprospiraceae bacterium]MBK7699140.1 putative DNA binding domain-containing protein [Saprospiraceae bacterium]MBK8825460.1 putative DNA binding domain-containing protein [Saprospiraceae bacterium]MBK8886497.1 putative DNA binding domain-containing protein [Saprospiraceae bacterium]